MSNISIMAQAPLQIYCSALAFAPSGSLVRTQYSHEVPAWISSLPEVQREWNEEELDIEAGEDAVKLLEFSRIGRGLIAFGRDGLRLWDETTGVPSGKIRTLGLLMEDDSMVQSLDGRFLAFTSVTFNPHCDARLRLWDMSLQAERGDYPFDKAPGCDRKTLAFSPNGDLLATSEVKGIILWDMNTMDLRTCIGVNYSARILSFSPNGRYLGVVGTERMELWDACACKLVVDLEHDYGGRYVGLFSPVEAMFAFGSRDLTVRVFDVENNDVRLALNGHASEVIDMIIVPKGRLLASVSDGECIVWDLVTGARRYSLPHELTDQKAPVTSPDGKLFAWRTDWNTISIFHTETGVRQSAHSAAPSLYHPMAFSPDSRLLAWASSDITIRDVKRIPAAVTSRDDRPKICTVDFTVDGRVLVSRDSTSGVVRVYAREGKAFRCLLTTGTSERHPFTISTNGSRFAHGSFGGIVKVFDIPDGRHSLTVYDRRAGYPLAFSPDGQLLASVTEDKCVVCYNFITDASFSLPGGSGSVRCIAFSPDGGRVAFSVQGNISLWDVDSLSLVWTTDIPDVGALAFSPDGRWLVARQQNSRILVLEQASGAHVKHLDLPFGGMNRVEFSADGRQLITDRGTLAFACGAHEPDGPEGDSLAHLYLINDWITLAGRNLLWLPRDYRPPRCSLHLNTLALYKSNGDVTILELDPARIDAIGSGAVHEIGQFEWQQIPLTVAFSQAVAWQQAPRRKRWAVRWKRLLRCLGVALVSGGELSGDSGR
jgi:WD40 repeat protein